MRHADARAGRHTQRQSGRQPDARLLFRDGALRRGRSQPDPVRAPAAGLCRQQRHDRAGQPILGAEARGRGAPSVLDRPARGAAHRAAALHCGESLPERRAGAVHRFRRHRRGGRQVSLHHPLQLSVLRRDHRHAGHDAHRRVGSHRAARVDRGADRQCVDQLSAHRRKWACAARPSAR